MYFLYYAGMAKDGITEQIGVATSTDGLRFERANGGRPVVTADPNVAWKSARACNPAVVKVGDELVMFYHGAQADRGGRTVTHTIGIARSRNGIDWDCPREPVLSAADVDRAALRATPSGVIEPAVVVDDRGYRMWFQFYRGSIGEAVLLHARSSDGYRWSIDPEPWFTPDAGNGAGVDYTCHYPEIVRADGGDELWITVRNLSTKRYAIHRGALGGGRTLRDMRPVLPEPQPTPTARWFGRMPRIGNLARRVRAASPECLGYAHSHVVESALYVHTYYDYGSHFTMNIGRHPLPVSDGRMYSTVLGVSSNPRAWDSSFVADPFVLRT